MKRLFLLSAALVAATCSFAQKAELRMPFNGDNAAAAQKVYKKNLMPRAERLTIAATTDARQAKRRSKTSGTYCYPTGGLYYGWSAATGYGYYNSVYSVAPFTEITHKGSVVGNWHYGNNDTGIVDSVLVDTYAPNYAVNAPTLVNKIDSFNIGMNNFYYMSGQQPDCLYGIIDCDTLCTMFPCDIQAGMEYNNTISPNMYAWGGLDNGNLFGSGKILATEEGENDFVCYGISQDYKALASPLYLENLFLSGHSYKEYPLGENDTLTAIIATEDEIIDTMYCVASEVQPFTTDNYMFEDSLYYIGQLEFTKKTVDELGMESSEPVIIPAGVDFYIAIYGFDSPTVDFGAYGVQYPDEDENAVEGMFMVTDGTARRGHYYSNCALYLGMTALFDNVEVLDNSSFKDVPEGTNMNALRVSADGKTCTTEGQDVDGDYNQGAILVGTAFPFVDHEGYDNYTLVSDDDTDWITWQVDNSTYADVYSNMYGYNAIYCECEPLPAGTSGRMAIVRVEGKGVTSEPFVVLQGDAQMPTAIESVLTATKSKSTKVYNLAGQQMNTNAKGLLIKGGKKVIVK